MEQLLDNIQIIYNRKRKIKELSSTTDKPKFSSDGQEITNLLLILDEYGIDINEVKAYLPEIIQGGVDTAPIGAIQDPAGSAIGTGNKPGGGGASGAIYKKFTDLLPIPNILEGQSIFNSSTGPGKKILHTHSPQLKGDPSIEEDRKKVLNDLGLAYLKALQQFNGYVHNLDVTDQGILNLVPISASIYAKKFQQNTLKHLHPSYTLLAIALAIMTAKNNDILTLPKLNLYYYKPEVKKEADKVKQALLNLSDKTKQTTSTTQYKKVFDELILKSEAFESRIKFPTSDNRIKNISNNDVSKEEKIGKHAMNTRIVIHESVLTLINDFLKHKKQYGTQKEKNLYNTMNTNKYIQRLIEKRPLTFFMPYDITKLRKPIIINPKDQTPHNTTNLDKKKYTEDWLKVGKDNEGIIKIEDYMTYDEIQIAVLIGTSTPTYFINNGERFNKGIKGVDGTYEEKGIYIGLVGARFEKPDKMESQHILIQQKIPDVYPDLLSIWAKFYNIPKFPQHNEVYASEEFIQFNNNKFFNVEVYKSRMRISIETFLYDANDRAKQNNKKAYCHVVGLGTGAWAIEELQEVQENLIVNTFYKVLSDNAYEYISDIDFSWFDKASFAVKTTNKIKDINIYFSKRNPADPLTGQNKGKLLVAMYAWDGNSYPGNEYWRNMLAASGDPAAACCSTIPELQNPEINPYLLQNIFKIANEPTYLLGQSY